MKKLLFILAGILGAPLLVWAINVSVPTAPSNGYGLVSTTTGQWLATSTLFITSGSRIGIGTTNPTGVNANAILTVAGTGSQDIIASTTDNTTLSDAILQAYAPGARVFLGAHGTNQVSTRYGLTLGGWGELGAFNSSSGTVNGLIIGTNPAVPIVFGTNNLERMRILSNGNVGIGTLTPNFLLETNGTASSTILFGTNATTSTLGITGLATPAGAFLAINAQGSVIATTTPSGTSKFASTTNGIVPNGGVTTRIGVGTTTNPLAMLDLYSNGSTMPLRVSSSTSPFNSYFEVEQNGLVGIGTAAAISPLTVNYDATTSAASNIGLNLFGTAPVLRLGTTALASPNANGVYFGLNAAVGFTGNLFEAQLNGQNRIKVDANGLLTTFGGASIGSTLTTGSSISAPAGSSFILTGRSRLASDADGRFTLFNNALTGFTRLNFGGIATANPALTVNGIGLQFTLADGSAFASTTASTFGAGTTTSTALFGAQGASGGTANFLNFASSTGTSVFAISSKGELITNGNAPTVSTCGTTPSGSVVGDDTSGTVTVGGGVVTACTITFYATKGKTIHPMVQVEGATAIASTVSAKSSTGFTVTFAATLGGGSFDYFVPSSDK